MPIPKILASVPIYNAVTPEPFMFFMVCSQETGRAELRGEYSLRWMATGPKVNQAWSVCRHMPEQAESENATQTLVQSR
jgi:hypothetical protein